MIKRGLEKKLWQFAIITTFLFAIVFLSANITGNVTGPTLKSSNIIGSILFLIGLIGTFVFLKKRSRF